MANYEDTKYNYSGSSLTGIQGVNTGIIIPWGSSSIPSGFLECNGQAVSRSTYAALFAVVGTTYGVGDGSTTFNVPDLQDRVTVNKSNTKSLAQTGGANTVATTGNITINVGNTTLSSSQIAAHTHSANRQMFNGAGNPNFPAATASMNTGSTGGDGAHTHNLTGATFTGGSDSVLQPYLVLIYIIKT